MKTPKKCASSLKYKWGKKTKTRTPRKAVDHYVSANSKWAVSEFVRISKHNGAPKGWSWKKSCKGKYRKLPLPWRNAPQGTCKMCGGKIYSLGWHKPWGDRKLNKKANWHAVCIHTYLLYTRPKKKRGSEIDHFTPLYRAYRVWGERKDSWPAIAHFWSPDNIQYISPEEHKAKSSTEAKERSSYRQP